MRRLMGRVATALSWRGDGRLPVWGWLSALAVVWLAALSLQSVEPAIGLVPPALTLAFAGGLLLQLTHGQDFRWAARLEMPAVMVALACVTLGVFGFLIKDKLVIDTGDHQFMMTRAEVFIEGLRRGRWLHWTHFWQGGDTLVDLYPIEANLITGLFYLLAPKGVSFVQAYTAFVVWTWWLGGVATYYLARRFSGPIVAGILSLGLMLEVGHDVWGGVWHAAIYWGMIHNTLALVLGMFATALQVDLIRKVTTKRFVACTLLVILTACGHALGMLYAALSTVALLVAFALASERRREVGWSLLASGLGMLCAGIWILPFSHGLATLGYRVAVGGLEYQELGKGLIAGTAPTSSLGGLFGLGLVAGLAALLSGEIAVVITALVALFLVLLSLTPLQVSSRLLHYFPALLDGQPPRMLTAVKFAIVPSLAWLLQGVLCRLKPSASLRIRPVVAWALVIGLLLYGPGRVAVGAWDSAVADLRSQVERKAPGARAHTGADYLEVFDWLRKERERDPSPTLWRTAVLWRSRNRHATWSEGPRIKVPIVDTEQWPSNFLTIRPREQNAASFRSWNIRFTLTETPQQPFDGLVKRKSVGSIHVWELVDYDPRYVVAPQGVAVTDVQLSDDEVRFRVSGTPPGGSDLTVRTAWFPRWRATQGTGGPSLPVSRVAPRPDAAPKQEQIQVHAGDGEVVLSCTGTMPRFWHGLVVSLVGCLGLVAAASQHRRTLVEGWLQRAFRRVGQWWAIVKAALLRLPSKHKIVVAAGSATLLFGCVAALRFRGAVGLTLPAVQGLGPARVSMQMPGGTLSTCKGEWWRDRYVCEGTFVDWWLGKNSTFDGSGEFGKHWPGIRVRHQESTNPIQIVFPSVRLRDASLRLSMVVSGTYDVRAQWGAVELVKKSYSGEASDSFRVAANEPSGTADLTLTLTPKNKGNSIVFKGEAVR